jgi:phage terminase Nu1 subunit (DNA packaging protein)
MARKQELKGTGVDLARLLCITDRRVRQLVTDGIITKQPEGDYLLPEAIAEYYAFKYKPDEAVDYMEEKALHEKAKRALAELELAKRRNEVHDAEDVQIVMVDMLTNLRSQLLGLPTKMAQQLAERDAGYIDKALTKEIEERLSELSDYSPTMFDMEAAADEEEDT